MEKEDGEGEPDGGDGQQPADDLEIETVQQRAGGGVAHDHDRQEPDEGDICQPMEGLAGQPGEFTEGEVTATIPWALVIQNAGVMHNTSML